MDHRGTETLHGPLDASFVYGSCMVIQTVNEMASEIAGTDIPVLIVGESGTGKEVYAKLIHRLSLQQDLQFSKFNCGSYDVEPLNRAFRQSRHGHSLAQRRGTLYLDNVQELDLHSQRAVLSHLAKIEDTVSGLRQSVRVISSSDHNLEAEVETGRFRRELYFRLNGVCLQIPPLRQRVEDIPLLTEHFLQKYSTAMKKNAPPLDEKAIELLSTYLWPGNVRELENLVRKAVVFGDFQIAINELLSSQPSTHKLFIPAHAPSLKLVARAASKKAERELILQALERTRWNRKQAARDLQISYKSLLYKIKQIEVFNGKNSS